MCPSSCQTVVCLYINYIDFSWYNVLSSNLCCLPDHTVLFCPLYCVHSGGGSERGSSPSAVKYSPRGRIYTSTRTPIGARRTPTRELVSFGRHKLRRLSPTLSRTSKEHTLQTTAQDYCCFILVLSVSSRPFVIFCFSVMSLPLPTNYS